VVSAGAARAGELEFEQVNLVSDQPGHAKFTDPNLVNAWGIARSPDPTPPSEWWVANNGSNTATLYLGDGTAESLIVNTPADPTGQVFYGGDKFIVSDDKGNTGPARFIFAAESGTISAWSPGVPPPGPSTQAFVMYDGSDEGDSYKGLALATDCRGKARLYATDFHNNRVVVLDDTFNEVHLGKRAFRDRELPRHYAPFGIAAFGDRIFVTYAVQDADAGDDVASSTNTTSRAISSAASPRTGRSIRRGAWPSAQSRGAALRARSSSATSATARSMRIANSGTSSSSSAPSKASTAARW
jgi:uncharacterized protein (TIGR03118 family)